MGGISVDICGRKSVIRTVSQSGAVLTEPGNVQDSPEST